MAWLIGSFILFILLLLIVVIFVFKKSKPSEIPSAPVKKTKITLEGATESCFHQGNLIVKDVKVLITVFRGKSSIRRYVVKIY